MPSKRFLTDKQKQRMIRQFGLANPHKSGLDLKSSVEAAAAKYNVSARTVYRIRGRLLKAGSALRRTRADAGAPRFPEEIRAGVCLTIEQLMFGRGGLNLTSTEITRQLHSRFPDHCDRISYHQVHRYAQHLWAERTAGDEPPMRFEVPHVNFQWQVDDSVSDFFLQPDDPGDRPRRLVLSAAMDEKTRCYMYAHYTRNADCGAYAKLLFNAMTRHSELWPQCGVPERIRSDCGKVFQSAMASNAMEALGVQRSDAAPYHPQGKGKVERGFRTIHEGFEHLQPGWCPSDNKGDDAVDPVKTFKLAGDTWVDPRMDTEALLTVDEANARLHEWICAEYHTRKHRTLDCTPNEAWLEELKTDATRAAEPAKEVLFAHLLIPVPGGTRTVRRQTIQFNNLHYTHALLAGCDGVPIHVRYCHDDLTRVWCFDERGHCLCEAQLLPTFIVGNEMDHRKWQQLTREARRERQAHEAAIEAALATPATVERLHDRIHNQAQQAAPLLTPQPGEWQPPPDPDDEQLEGLSIGGIPLASGDR